MLYVDKYNTIRKTENENEILLFSLLQELKLFKEENPVNIDAGIDYIKVFNYQAFLRIEAQQVIDKYVDKFESITLGDVTQRDETFEIPLNVVFKDGTILDETIRIM